MNRNLLYTHQIFQQTADIESSLSFIPLPLSTMIYNVEVEVEVEVESCSSNNTHLFLLCEPRFY